jgi:hypothetical protein
MAETDIEWNISKDFGQALQGLINKVNEAAYTGTIPTWYNALWVLYINTSGHKKMDEKKIENIYTKLLSLRDKATPKPITTPQGKVYKEVEERELKLELMLLSRDLITEMHKAGLILPVTIDDKKAVYRR